MLQFIKGLHHQYPSSDAFFRGGHRGVETKDMHGVVSWLQYASFLKASKPGRHLFGITHQERIVQSAVPTLMVNYCLPSWQGIMFLPVLVCLFVCPSVATISQELVDIFSFYFKGMVSHTRVRSDSKWPLTATSIQSHLFGHNFVQNYDIDLNFFCR